MDIYAVKGKKYLNSKLALSMNIYTYVCMHVGMYA